MEELKFRIPKHIYNKLSAANLLSLKSILALDAVELQRKIDVDLEACKQIINVVATNICKDKIQTGLEIPYWGRLSTGCQDIDAVISGGFPANGINEVYGCSSVGKTQLALQMCLMVQFDNNVGGFKKGAVYISTEDIFPSRRLRQLSSLLPENFNLDLSYDTLEENIFIEHIADYEQLQYCLYSKLPVILKNVPIGIIILDSIAGPFRAENEGADFVKRSKELYCIAKKLYQFSSHYNLVVLCLNQVVQDTATSEIKPALGYAWSNLVTNRFEISRLSEGKTRHFRVVNAPDLPSNSCNFVIEGNGLHGIR